MSGKEIVMDWLRELPETLSLEHVIDALAIRAELRLARADVDAGRIISQEEMEQELAEMTQFKFSRML